MPRTLWWAGALAVFATACSSASLDPEDDARPGGKGDCLASAEGCDGAQDSLANLAPDHLGAGDPGCHVADMLADCTPDEGCLDSDSYRVCHHNEHKAPEFVAYYLSQELLKGDVSRDVGNFKRDTRLSDEGRAELADYRHSGYHRGHMAPAAIFMRNEEVMKKSFLLSNVAAQTPDLNARVWCTLERQVRDAVEADGGEAWVVTGNVFEDEPSRYVGPELEFDRCDADKDCETGQACTSSGTCVATCEHAALSPAEQTGDAHSAECGDGNHCNSFRRCAADRVAVPSHSFKAVLRQPGKGALLAAAWLVPNHEMATPRLHQAGDTLDYAIAVDELEDVIGYDLFSALPDDVEDSLERAPLSVQTDPIVADPDAHPPAKRGRLDIELTPENFKAWFPSPLEVETLEGKPFVVTDPINARCERPCTDCNWVCVTDSLASDDWPTPDRSRCTF